jgi:hypothetical protein
VQKSAKKRSFLPSFLAQKQIGPIKSHFILPPTTPFFKISLKNPIFLKIYLEKIMKAIESNWFFQQLASRICYNIAYLTSKSKRMGRGDFGEGQSPENP